MNALRLDRYTLTAITLSALLTGCGGTQNALSVAPSSVTPNIAHASHGTSWMLPEAKNDALLYMSSPGGTVYVYSYPAYQQVGSLTGFYQPAGQCVDAKGDVWITDGTGLVEYAHGASSPTRQITIENGGAVGCSVAPNGDLAVTAGIETSPSHERVFILVYKGATGTPAEYANQKCKRMGSPGYDDHGNLYVEGLHTKENRGYGYKNESAVCELPSGSATHLRKVLFGAGGVNISHLGPASVMWDGKYLVFTDVLSNTRLYRTKESSNGDLQIVSYTTLGGEGTCGYDRSYNVFLVGIANPPVNHHEAKVALSSGLYPFCSSTFDAWKYPAGGSPSWSIEGYYTGESVSFPKQATFDNYRLRRANAIAHPQVGANDERLTLPLHADHNRVKRFPCRLRRNAERVERRADIRHAKRRARFAWHVVDVAGSEG
jgi:hypothetical protein